MRGTRGVSGIVTFNDSPAVLDDAVVEEIRGRIVDGFVVMESDRPIDCPFRKGERVRIVDGPMYGLTGVFQQYIPSKQRVDILMTMFGRQTPVRFGLDEIEHVSYAVA